MAKPRVFVSSTFYDLKHIRSSLDNFIESLGFEPILSEKGGVPYAHDEPLDESCYKEVATCDILVMIVGGRYGSERSATRNEPKPDDPAFAMYDSVTKQELKTALDLDIPVYIFVEKAVYADYETYLKNIGNSTVIYAHASVNTLRLIDEILKLPRNNPVHQFERYGEIESWLRSQWAGRFRDLLQAKTERSQLVSLQAQVEALSAINKTFQVYLEQIYKQVDKAGSEKVIENQRRSLLISTLDAAMRELPDFEHMRGGHELSAEDAFTILIEGKSLREIRRKLEASLVKSCGIGKRAPADEINRLRLVVGMPPLQETPEDLAELASQREDVYRRESEREYESMLLRKGKLEGELAKLRSELAQKQSLLTGLRARQTKGEVAPHLKDRLTKDQVRLADEVQSFTERVHTIESELARLCGAIDTFKGWHG